MLLEHDAVAEAQRLGDGEHQPGDEVGERLARGEADDGGGDRARGQQRAADGAHRLELRQRDGDADDEHDRVDQPLDEPQPRLGLGRQADVAAGEREAQHGDDQRPRRRSRPPRPTQLSVISRHDAAATVGRSCSTASARCVRARAAGAAAGRAARASPLAERRARDARRDRVLPRPHARARPTPRRCAALRGRVRGRSPAATCDDAARARSSSRRSRRRRAGARRAGARAGLRLVVVSNWDVSLHEVLARTGLTPLLDGAVTSAEVGAAKPDPAPAAARACASRGDRRRVAGRRRRRGGRRAPRRPPAAVRADRPAANDLSGVLP